MDAGARLRRRKRKADKVFPVHRAWVKQWGCAVRGCAGWPIDFAHGRTAANSGTSTKPHDGFGVAYCHTHHMEEHAKGDRHMRLKYGVDRFKLAAELVRESPDVKMRESFLQLPEHVQNILWAA